MLIIFTIGLVLYVGNVNAKSGRGGRGSGSSSSTTIVLCYDQHGHPISCPGAKVAGIVVGCIFGAFFLVAIIWSVIDWCSKRKKMREKVAESSGDVEASPVRKPPRRSWFLCPIPRMFSKYRRVPNPVDTVATVHDATDGDEGEDNMKHSLRHEKSKVSAPPSPASEVSIPLPPYESIEKTPYPPPTWIPPG